jgi:3-hydroxyisobutyrate dehydrogenase-like beta-hydroxyacid dehydrogenase
MWTDPMARIAFIGLGRMGRGMAGRYLDGGHSVAVWNRSQVRAGDLIGRGARFARSAADAADGADAIVTMVPGSCAAAVSSTSIVRSLGCPMPRPAES